MHVYRLAKKDFSKDLSGTGAKIFGGRWNPKGLAVIYTSGSISLAVLELMVHIQPKTMPENIYVITLDIPDDCRIIELNGRTLPKKWDAFPPIQKTAELGSKWLKTDKSLVLKVPSAIVNEEFNYLVNPLNHQMNRVKIIKTEKFEFDSRIGKLIEHTYKLG